MRRFVIATIHNPQSVILSRGDVVANQAIPGTVVKKAGFVLTRYVQTTCGYSQ